MQIQFRVITRMERPQEGGSNTVYLKIDNWNDFSFVTMFEVYVYDENGRGHSLPNIKIGFVGQTTATSTFSTLDKGFAELSSNYFSVATDVDFYRKLWKDFSPDWRDTFLVKLRDVVKTPSILDFAKDEEVFKVSHLRSVSINAIRTQFKRVLAGDSPPTDFNFHFFLPSSPTFAGFDLGFNVEAGSLPSTNIHALIGRNGVGKTTILKHMVKAISGHSENGAEFYQKQFFADSRKRLGKDFFANLVSIAFSAFDPFDLPAANENPSDGTPYSYIGLTDYSGDDGAILKSRAQLHEEFVESLKFCLSELPRRQRWADTISVLQSDSNFAEMQLLDLLHYDLDTISEPAGHRIAKMSSGHAIAILMVTQLVAKVEEKTLVLIDEPESHLHPPLLSALVRSLSQLLYKQNGVAIIATHSPVVLQEIPKSCVWKLYRERTSSEKFRPEVETFGENVGALTRDVFRLEVEKSGFHTLLREAVASGETYDEILSRFQGNLGFEARGILRAMTINRDSE
ncbi:AAA family ATPase [Bordetella sp. N]|uniref:AAA family ATPase n=1 Tax=Bordetella sp. N TaxID=1746199 RepID=UPI0009EBA0B8|nr:AAA family ATPase [Bordetella sp. N]